MKRLGFRGLFIFCNKHLISHGTSCDSTHGCPAAVGLTLGCTIEFWGVLQIPRPRPLPRETTHGLLIEKYIQLWVMQGIHLKGAAGILCFSELRDGRGFCPSLLLWSLFFKSHDPLRYGLRGNICIKSKYYIDVSEYNCGKCHFKIT